MSKECWVGPTYPVEPVSRTFGLVAHPLELAAYPPDDIGIDPLQGRTQLRLIEVAVVGDPAAVHGLYIWASSVRDLSLR